MPHETELLQAEAVQTIEAHLDHWQQRLDRLSAEAPDIAGSRKMPSWWYQDQHNLLEIDSQLKAEGPETGNTSRYYELYSKYDELCKVIDFYSTPVHPVDKVASRLGDDFVGAALRIEPEDGPLRRGMLDSLRQHQAEPTRSVTTEVSVLMEAYTLESATELLGIGGTTYNDELQTLLRQKGVIGRIQALDVGNTTGMSPEEIRTLNQPWMTKAVTAASDMTPDEASDYVFSASREISQAPENLLRVLGALDHFGADRIRAIAATTGIHGLDGYSIEQLERMEEFVLVPAKVAERLKDHDVTVVFTNRVGDHNGVLRDTATYYDDDNSRALFFEINAMSDIYKRMILLGNAGIKPSTLALAAHSGPGQFMVSDDREKNGTGKRRDIAAIAGRALIARANTPGEFSFDPGDYGYSMHGMKGMARLVEDYMRPSRGIDDDPADIGRKKFIFQACHAGTEDLQSDLDEAGVKVVSGKESVVSQLGKDLIASGVTANIDLYGAAAAMQMVRTDRGVHYTSRTEGKFVRSHHAAVRVRVEKGLVTQQEVYDIPLRK